jgi:NADPH-dependent ferric siderophore reductase
MSVSLRRHPPRALSISEDSHVLLAGGTSDIRAIRALLLELPGTAYGQVFIEVASPIQVVSLPAPPRVSVTWLFRHSRSHDSARGIPVVRGELMADAVSGWISEWLPADLIEPDLAELQSSAARPAAGEANDHSAPTDGIGHSIGDVHQTVIGATILGATGDYYLWIGCAESPRASSIYRELAAILGGESTSARRE